MKPYLKYIFKLFRRQKKLLVRLILLILVATSLRLAQPYLYKIIVDILANNFQNHSFTNKDGTLLIQLVLGWFILAVFGSLLNSYNSYLGWTMGEFTFDQAHREGFEKLLNLDYQKHTQKHSSEYAKILDNADNACWLMSIWWFNRFIPATIGFLGMVTIAFSINWEMTLASLAVIPFGLGIIIFMMNKYEAQQVKVNKLWEKVNEHASDQLTNIVTYKLNQDQKLFQDVHHKILAEARVSQSYLNKKWRIVDMLNPDILAHFFVMGMGVILVKNGEITLGTLFMFMGLLNEILIPLRLLSDILPDYSRRARHIEKLIKLLEEKNLVNDPQKAKKIKNIQGKIEFKNVSFNYPNKGKTGFQLKNISFTINPGEHIALVGHSGSGKSTIMALLTRLVDPIEGEILLDGINIKNFTQTDYRKYIGTVLQENSLYNETIAQNIAYGKPKATLKEITKAAKIAQADEFILKLSEKYHTFIGEKGVRLSGGEKQRLAISRAVLKDPKIVVLDEPTSALDSITESKVQKALDLLIRNRSSLVVAHRLSTVKHSDKILVMEKGELITQGNHVELLKNCKTYQKMVQLQTSGFLADE